MAAPRKLTFQEVWNSTTIFFVDEVLEDEIDNEVAALLQLTQDERVSAEALVSVESIATFLMSHAQALDVILYDIELSEEKFLRIISLLRQIGDLPGGFENEWSIAHIKSKLAREPDFAQFVAALLVDGKRNPKLSAIIPRYYLETLNYREIKGGSTAARRVRYKRSLIGMYGGRKGYKVEEQIKQRLQVIQDRYGIPYAQGRSLLFNTNLDFALPGLEDPWVIIMSSFQETTSSGQTTKARDMFQIYEQVRQLNDRNRQQRVFINFVDGGGWLARKRDLERLVNQCHYFINLRHLDMLEPIVLAHVPAKYHRS